MHSTLRWYSIKVQGQSVSREKFLRQVLRARNDEFWFSNSSEDLGEDVRFFRRIRFNIDRFTAKGERQTELVESVEWLDVSLIEGKKSSFLKILNPGRNLRGLMIALESILGFGFSASPMLPEKIRVESMLAQFEVVRIIGLKVTNAVISDDCIGRMEFVSKNGINPLTLRPLKGLDYKTDFVKYEVLLNGLQGSVALSSSGLVRVGGALAPRIVELISARLSRQ